jgi:hypothetical protein
MHFNLRLATAVLAAIPFVLTVTAGAASAQGLVAGQAGHTVVTKHDTTADDDCDPNDNGKFEGFFGFFKQDASEDCHTHRHHHNR